MGFKRKNTSQSNNCNPFKIGGLIFDSEDDYLVLKNIDKNILQTVKSVKDGSIDIEEVFNNIEKISVKETYYDACEEMDGLFKNVITLLLDEGDIRFWEDYKVGRCFFNKINVIKYCDSDDDDF